MSFRESSEGPLLKAAAKSKTGALPPGGRLAEILRLWREWPVYPEWALALFEKGFFHVGRGDVREGDRVSVETDSGRCFGRVKKVLGGGKAVLEDVLMTEERPEERVLLPRELTVYRSAPVREEKV